MCVIFETMHSRLRSGEPHELPARCRFYTKPPANLESSLRSGNRLAIEWPCPNDRNNNAYTFFKLPGRPPMTSFELVEPRSLEEAFALLDRDDPAVRPIAGGTALTLMMKGGLFRPLRLVSLRRIEPRF